MTSVFQIERMPSPVGEVLIVTDLDDQLRAIDFEDYEARMLRLLRLHYGTGVTLQPRDEPSAARRVLGRYFAGDIGAITALKAETGGTVFQRQVWRALRDIPAGETESYGALAERIGRPKAVRAVGLANGANPVGIVVPCHRVIGANGSLTGYGGGLDRKRWLIDHERAARA